MFCLIVCACVVRMTLFFAWPQFLSWGFCKTLFFITTADIYIYIYIYLTTYLNKWSTNYIVAKYIVKKQLQLDAYFTWNETKNSLEEIVEAKYILPELRFLHDPFDLYLKWKKKRKNQFIITNSWKRDSKSII